MKTENCYNCGKHIEKDFWFCPYCGTELDARLKDFCMMVYEAFGWQGGTIHQIVREIKRLREIEKNLINGGAIKC